MLKLKHHMTLPHLSIAHEVKFAEIPYEEDELIEAIEAVTDNADTNWELTPTPDTNQLEEFWNKVVADIHADPQWTPIGVDEQAA